MTTSAVASTAANAPCSQRTVAEPFSQTARVLAPVAALSRDRCLPTGAYRRRSRVPSDGAHPGGAIGTAGCVHATSAVTVVPLPARAASLSMAAIITATLVAA